MATKKTSLPFLMMALFLSYISTSSASIIHSAVADFSTTTNSESSRWSYRYSNNVVRDGSYQLLTTFANFGNWSPTTNQWSLGANSGAFGLPAIGVNNTGAPLNWAGNASGFSWLNESLWLHPYSGGLVMVSWLSSTTETVDIDFSFTDIDGNGGTGIKWFVDLNSSSVNLSSGILANGATSNLLSLSNVAVNAGDRINFIVDPNGSIGFDSTALTATIKTNSIPEPSTFMLAAIGLVIIFKRKMRRKNNRDK